MAGKRHRIAHVMPGKASGAPTAALRIAHRPGRRFDSAFFCVRSAPVVSEFSSPATTPSWRDAYPVNGYRYFLHESLQLAQEFRRRGITLVHCANVQPARCGPGRTARHWSR